VFELGALNIYLKPIDIIFLGSHSPKRELFISENSAFLNQYNCRIIFARMDNPRLATTPGYYANEKRNQLLKSSKILITIHATNSFYYTHFSNNKYFEWHRALIAIANKCLLISESSDYFEPLVNQEHIIVTEVNQLITKCEHYLKNEKEREEIVQRAYNFTTQNWNCRSLCKIFLEKY
jgi:spore maturation protein CgeB